MGNMSDAQERKLPSLGSMYLVYTCIDVYIYIYIVCMSPRVLGKMKLHC
jgi:hypothetical protein